MSRGRDDHRSVDGVRIHARLVVVVHADQGPVRNHSSNADRTISCRASDKILDGSSIEELDVGEREDLGQKRGSEECLCEVSAVTHQQ